MEKVILRAMVKDPRRRYNSVSELRNNLISAGLYNRLENNDTVKVMEDTIKLPRFRKGAGEKPEKKSIRNHNLSAPLKLWTWVMIALIVIGFLLGIYLSATVLAKGEVKVPDLSEKTVEGGQKRARANWFNFGVGKNHQSSDSGRKFNYIASA